MAKVKIVAMIEDLYDHEFLDPLVSAIKKQVPEVQLDKKKLLSDLAGILVNTCGEWIDVPEGFVEK
jgi:hypothetical protein